MEKNLVLVTGMSGAGKTSAMNALEDLGYYCIDSYPSELLDELEEMLEKEDPKYDRLALSVPASEYLDFCNFFDNRQRPLQIVFVDASDEELLLRYRFTRRKHPLITARQAATLEEAIELERDYFESLHSNMKDTIHIDTTRLTQQALSNEVRRYFQSGEETDFSVTFQSFGFKNGVPMDADEIIDVRFLPNPFYEASLKKKTGNDPEVYNYVMNHESTRQFTERLVAYLDFVLKAYSAQQKNHLIISVGCTGGQHRSVSICNFLYDHYKDQYSCYKAHRDAGVRP